MDVLARAGLTLIDLNAEIFIYISIISVRALEGVQHEILEAINRPRVPYVLGAGHGVLNGHPVDFLGAGHRILNRWRLLATDAATRKLVDVCSALLRGLTLFTDH